MQRSVTIHGALLAGALIAAYFVWTREPDSSQDTVPILSLRSLDSLSFDAPERKVHIERKHDDRGTYYWVKVVKWEAPPSRLPPPPPVRPGPGHPAPGHAAPGHPVPGHPVPGHPAPGKPGAATPPSKTKPAKPKAKIKPAKPAKPAKAKPAKPAKPKPKAKPAPSKPGPANKTLRQDPKASPDKPAKAKPTKAKPAKAKPAKAKPAKAKPKADKPGAAKSEAKSGSTPPAAGVAAPQPAAKPAKPKKPKKVRKEQQFLGNSAVEELMKSLARMPALRALGRVGNKKLQAFGLDKSKTKLTLVSGSAKRAFLVGNKTFGNTDYYIQDLSDKRVYVIGPSSVQQLEYAEHRLIDRDLHEFKTTEVETAVIEAKGARKKLTQHNRQKPAAAFWTVAGTGDQRRGKDIFRNWMNKLQRLRVLEFPKPGESPKGLQPLFSVSYALGSKKLGFIRLMKRRGPPPAAPGAAAPAAGEQYYALTGHTRVPVKVSKAIVEELARDLPGLLKEQ